MELLYQDEINKFINGVTFDTCPKTIAFVGEIGSGRKTATKILADNLGVRLSDITKKLSFDDITEIYTSVTPCVYAVDGDQLTDRDQYSILKLLEEPPKLSVIVVCCEGGKLLDTIMNRCYALKFKPYEAHELESFVDNKDNPILEMFRTPGKVMKYQNYNLEPYYKLANNMVANFNWANISNILTISNKFDFDKKVTKEDKLDFSLFVNVLHKVIYRNSVKNSDVRPLYDEVSSLLKNTMIPNLNNKFLLERFLLKAKMSKYLWE